MPQSASVVSITQSNDILPRRLPIGWLTHLGRRIRHKGARHWITLAVILVGGYLAGRALDTADFLNGARLSLYGLQTKLYIHPQDQPHNTMVLMIRDEDYWGDQFQGRSPLNREQLGKILTSLKQVGVKRVVFDIDLRLRQYPGATGDAPSLRPEDDKLLAAITDFCRPAKSPTQSAPSILVLGTSLKFEPDGDKKDAEGYFSEVPSVFTVDPHPAHSSTPEAAPAKTAPAGVLPFLPQLVSNNPSCPAKGYMQLPTDLRQIPEDIETEDGQQLNSLSLEAVHRISQDAYTAARSHATDSFHFPHFLSQDAYGYSTLGGPYAVNAGFFSFTQKMLNDAQQAAQKSPTVPQPLLQSLYGKTVLIGGDWHTRAYHQGPTVDQYDSPLGPMPGVFLHANYIEAFLDPRGIATRIPDFVVKITEWALVLFIVILGLYEIEGAWKWAWRSTALVATIVVVYVLLLNIGIFMDFFIPICILIAHALLDDFFALLHDASILRKDAKEHLHANH